MRKGLRIVGALALSLASPHFAAAQSPNLIPPPGTPVGPPDVPAHVLTAPTPAPLASPFDRGDKPANRRILNTATAQIDYRIDTVGPSGVGRVDIYITPDRGNTWTKLAEDTDKQSPAMVNLPGEGLFGVRIAITNGNGFGGRVPKAGDRPQLYVEVDASSPTVSMQPHEMVASIGAIDVRWNAADANLAPEPISLYYRTGHDSGWRAIAQGIKNDGAYRWMLPRDIAPAIFLKIEAVDLAGNTTKVESPTPILLDQSEPEATVVDVAPFQRGMMPSSVAPVSMQMPDANPQPPLAVPPSLPATLPAAPPQS